MVDVGRRLLDEMVEMHRESEAVFREGAQGGGVREMDLFLKNREVSLPY